MLARLTSTLLVVAVAAGLAIVAWPQAVGLERSAWVAQAIAFRGADVAAAALAAVVLVAVGLVARRTRLLAGVLAIVLLAFSAGVTGVLVVRGIGAPAVPQAGPDDVTVLSWNTLGDSVPASEIARVARAAHADVIALPETTAGTADAVAQALSEGGRSFTPHTIALDRVAPARSTSLVLADSLGRYRVDRGAGDTSVLPSVVAVPAGGQRAPVIVAVHAVAPAPDELRDWRADLAWLGARCGGGNVVLAGDFNATLDHMTGLQHRAGAQLGGCRDAALATRNAAVGTWPTNLPPLVGAPIDHVLATPNWRTAGFRVLAGEDAAGSDHRPVLARLTPAG